VLSQSVHTTQAFFSFSAPHSMGNKIIINPWSHRDDTLASFMMPVTGTKLKMFNSAAMAGACSKNLVPE